MSTHPCIPGIDPTWSCGMILSKYRENLCRRNTVVKSSGRQGGYPGHWFLQQQKLIRSFARQATVNQGCACAWLILVALALLPCSKPSLYISVVPVSGWDETAAGPSYSASKGWGSWLLTSLFLLQGGEGTLETGSSLYMLSSTSLSDRLIQGRLIKGSCPSFMFGCSQAFCSTVFWGFERHVPLSFSFPWYYWQEFRYGGEPS